MKVSLLLVMIGALTLPGCNFVSTKGVAKKTETRGLVIGDGGNFEVPVASPTPTPDPEAPATAQPTINDIPALIGNTFNLTGSAEPEAVVRVFVDGETVGETTADGTGLWVVELTDLQPGVITFSAVALAAGKTVSEPSSTKTTTVREPLAAPVITGPVGETSGIGVLLSGTSVPGVVVTAWVQGPALGGRDDWDEVSTKGTGGGAVTEADGLWTGDLGAEVTTPLSANGTYRAEAQAVLDLGDGGTVVSPLSEIFFISVQNNAAPEAPTITSIEQTEGGFWPLTISGTAEPGYEVVFFLEAAGAVDDGVPWTPFESTVAGDDGVWTYVIESLPPGSYLAAARAKDPENFYGDSSEVVDLVVPEDEPQP